MEKTISSSNNARIKIFKFLVGNKALLLMIVALVVASIISPVFFSYSNLRNVVRQNATNCILAFGFTCVLSAGYIDLSVGYMAGLMGVVAGLLDTRTILPAWFIIALVLGCGSLCGLLNSFVVETIKMPPFIVTLATGQIYRGLCYIISNNTPITGIGSGLKFLGQGYILWGQLPIPILLTAIFGVFFYIVLNKTVFGRWAVALGGNAETARVSGVNIFKTSMFVYMLLGVCCAMAGLLLTGRGGTAQPTAGAGMEMDAIAAVVIGGTPMSGGKAKVVGTFFGVILMGVLTNILNLTGLDPNFQYVLKGMMILVAIILDSSAQKYFNKQLRKAA